MCPQTSYSINIPAVSYPGQIADASYFRDVISALAVAAAVPYGVCVVQDTANGAGFDNLAAKVPSTTGSITTAGQAYGIVLADQGRAQDPSVVLPTYPINSALPVLRSGRVWVNSETAVADGGGVFVRYAANGGLTQLGAIRADADTAHAAALPNSVFRGAYAAAGYVVAEINLV